MESKQPQKNLIITFENQLRVRRGLQLVIFLRKKNEQRDLKTIEKSFHFLREKRKKKNDGKGSKKPHQTHENFMVLGINCRAGVVKEMIVVAFRMIETQQTRNETALRSYHQTVRNAPI